jgi:RHS repeat-associated protein
MFDPYGKVTVLAPDGVTVRAESAYGNPWTFTGRRLDGETGLMYFRNRMYSVDLGRFCQRDPLGYVDGMGLYAYVRGTPSTMVDPTGEICCVKDYVIRENGPAEGLVKNVMGNRGLFVANQLGPAGFYLKRAKPTIGGAFLYLEVDALLTADSDPADCDPVTRTVVMDQITVDGNQLKQGDPGGPAANNSADPTNAVSRDPKVPKVIIGDSPGGVYKGATRYVKSTSYQITIKDKTRAAYVSTFDYGVGVSFDGNMNPPVNGFSRPQNKVLPPHPNAPPPPPQQPAVPAPEQQQPPSQQTETKGSK